MAKKALIEKSRKPQRFKTRAYSRCNRCGRPRAVYKKFGLCRICLRDLAHEGVIPGMTKSSWYMQTDPIADMLTRIRNANKALQETVDMPSSRLKVEIARLLKEEGYIRDFRIVSSEEFNQGEENKKKHRPYDTLTVELKFGRNRERVITDLKRVSKPGRRVYARKDRLPRVLGGMGISILSTSNGLITSRTAAEKGVGGEVICFVW